MPESYELKEREDFDYKTKTYLINYEQNKARGYIDEINACIQAIYKILCTEKGKYIIYSEDYGIQLDDLFGKSVQTAAAILEERIKEALIYDERINDVTNFSFATNRRGELSVKFTANTVYGDVGISKEYAFMKGGSD